MAAEWAGFETVGQCEWADYPTKVLEKHWPDVPRWRDIRTLTKESFHERTGRTTVDLISGGFPCQPFSVAGKQRGNEDDRYLWAEMLRVISELRPTWVIGENVAGIINMALDQVLSDLESQGYETQTIVVPACAVDAPHKRDRVFILAYTDRNDQRTWNGHQKPKRNSTRKRISDSGPMETTRDVGNSKHNGLPSSTVNGIINQASNNKPKRTDEAGQFEGASESGNRKNVADTEIEGLERRGNTRDDGAGLAGLGESGWSIQNNWVTQPGLGRVADGVSDWSHEPDIPRIATGIKNRTDRLKCLGNAVVPQQVYPILKAIAEIGEP